MRTDQIAPSWGPRLRGLEGLRGIAALSVLIFHVAVISAQETTAAGVGRVLVQFSHGLTLFFVLSGFLLSRPFILWLRVEKSRPSIISFARNRLLRIYPGYLVALVATSALALARPVGGVGGDSHSDVTRLDLWDLSLAATLISNLTPSHIFSGLGVSWSLTTELSFYIVIPAIAILLAATTGASSTKRWKAWLLPLPFIVTGLAAKIWHAQHVAPGMRSAEDGFAWSANWTSVIARSLLEQADLFGWGIVAALLLSANMPDRTRRHVRNWCPPLALVCVLASVTAPGVDRWQTSLVAIACASALVWITLPPGPDSLAADLLELAPMRFLGEISFGIYLWHMPALLLLGREGLWAGDSMIGIAVTTLATTSITVVLAFVSYRYIERPALQLKSRPWRTTRRRSTPAS